jgi:hypothetical protein
MYATNWPARLSIALQDALIAPLERDGLVERDASGDYTPESEFVVNAAIWASDNIIAGLMDNSMNSLKLAFKVLGSTGRDY